MEEKKYSYDPFEDAKPLILAAVVLPHDWTVDTTIPNGTYAVAVSLDLMKFGSDREYAQAVTNELSDKIQLAMRLAVKNRLSSAEHS